MTPPLSRRRLLLASSALLGSAIAAETARPTTRLAESKPPIDLEKQVPRAFAGWMVDGRIAPVLPDPSLQAMLDSLYSQVLARTYVDARGQAVMLSIAYGSDQSSEATAVHRPEFCYSAQGFEVRKLPGTRRNLGGHEVPLARLAALIGRRRELISYWVTLDERATLPGLGRKIEQVRYGLRGLIPDGMLVRASSVNGPDEAAFALQERFLGDMAQALPSLVRSRYFGQDRA